MRKHFLLLFLMALLPLAGWAEDAQASTHANGDIVFLGANGAEVTDATYTTLQAVLPTPSVYGVTGYVVDLVWKDPKGNTITANTTDNKYYYLNAGNYTCQFYLNEVGSTLYRGTFTVKPHKLKVTASSLTGNNSLTYGDAVPAQDKYTVTFSDYPAALTTDAAKKASLDANVTGIDKIEYETNYYQWAPISRTADAANNIAEVKYYIRPVVAARLESTNYSFDPVDGVLNVNPKSIAENANKVTVATIADKTYNANNQFNLKDFVLTDNASKKALVQSATNNGTTSENDYAVDATEIKNAGTYNVTLTGKGNYTGTRTVKVVVKKKGLIITTLDAADVIYNGKTQTASELAVYDATSNPNGNVTVQGLQGDDKLSVYSSSNTNGIMTAPVSASGTDTYGTITLSYVGADATVTNAGTYTVTASGDKAAAQMFQNYAPTYVNNGKFTIKKRTLNLKIENQTREFNETDDFEAGVANAKGIVVMGDNTYANGEGLLNDGADSNPAEIHQITTWPTVKREAGSDAKAYALSIVENTTVIKTIVASGSNEEPVDVTANYDIKTNDNATFTIAGGTITILPMPVTITYGDKTDNIKLDAEIYGVLDSDKAAIKQLLKANKALVLPTVKDAGIYDANSRIKGISVDAEKFNLNTLTADLKKRYTTVDVSFYGTYTIKKRELTKITVKPQSMFEGQAATEIAVNADNVEILAKDYPLTPADYAQLATEIQLAFNTSASTATTGGTTLKVTPASVSGEGATPAVLTSTVVDAEGNVTTQGAANEKPYLGGLKLAWVSGVSKLKNFELPIKKASGEIRIASFDDQDADAKKVYEFGNLTVSLADAEVVLLSQSTFAAAEKDPATALAGKDGKKATVKFGKREIKQGIWTPIVLPFATSVKEVSEKLGYAVVDIMEAKGDGNVHFTLHLGDIPANTPFIVKAYANCDLAGVTGDANGYGAQAAVEFEKTIDFTTNIDATTKNAVFTDGAIQFIGVYAKNTSIYGSNNRYCSSTDGIWYKPNAETYTAENQMTIPTMKAYLHFGDNHAHTIYIQEPDGSTTAIEAIEADGMVVATDGWYTLNGMKLNSVPTEKGVYIHNGKKVVLK